MPANPAPLATDASPDKERYLDVPDTTQPPPPTPLIPVWKCDKFFRPWGKTESATSQCISAHVNAGGGCGGNGPSNQQKEQEKQEIQNKENGGSNNSCTNPPVKPQNKTQQSNEKSKASIKKITDTVKKNAKLIDAKPLAAGFVLMSRDYYENNNPYTYGVKNIAKSINESEIGRAHV